MLLVSASKILDHILRVPHSETFQGSRTSAVVYLSLVRVWVTALVKNKFATFSFAKWQTTIIVLASLGYLSGVSLNSLKSTCLWDPNFTACKYRSTVPRIPKQCCTQMLLCVFRGAHWDWRQKSIKLPCAILKRNVSGTFHCHVCLLHLFSLRMNTMM